MSGNYRCPSEVDKPLNLFDIAKLQKVFELPNKMAEKITSLLQKNGREVLSHALNSLNLQFGSKRVTYP